MWKRTDLYRPSEGFDLGENCCRRKPVIVALPSDLANLPVSINVGGYAIKVAEGVGACKAAVQEENTVERKRDRLQ